MLQAKLGVALTNRATTCYRVGMDKYEYRIQVKSKPGSIWTAIESINLDFLKRVIPGKLPLFFVVLIAIEVADLIFAFDSIPAVLAVTKDPLIVYSSNIFAILGLRAMYFVLSPFVDMFEYLHYTLGIIIVFVGIKMVADPIYHLPIGCALGFIFCVLAFSTCVGFIYKTRSKSL